MKRKLMSSQDAWRFGFEMSEDPLFREGTSLPKKVKACALQVTRTSSILRSNGLYRLINVRTPRDDINIYVTPTGRLRIFTDGKEWSR